MEPRGGGRGPGGGPERHAPGPPEQKPHRDPSFQLGVYIAMLLLLCLFVCIRLYSLQLNAYAFLQNKRMH